MEPDQAVAFRSITKLRSVEQPFNRVLQCDRAARLQKFWCLTSIDVKIPDAKDRDVVPAQNIGERVRAIMCV